MPTKRTRRAPLRRGGSIKPWVVRLIEHAEEPESGSEGEIELCAWLFWDAPVAGLPPADSPEGLAIMAPVHERAQRERARREQARRRQLERELRHADQKT